MKKCLLIVWCVCLLTGIGCSNKVSLGGKVVYSDDGSPLPSGTVGFETETYHARGIIQSDGTYQVSSASDRDGIPPGKYKVYVFATEYLGLDKNGIPITKPLVDDKYSNSETSGLEVEITAKTKTYDITVDRSTKKQSTRQVVSAPGEAASQTLSPGQ